MNISSTMHCFYIRSVYFSGGHPYLTGLSIAGGIFCLGVEGAIFGPLLLCCIMVVINLSRRYLHSPEEEEEVVLPAYERTSQYKSK